MSSPARPDGDDGFSLVEVLVALTITTLVMTSLTVFLVNSRHTGRYTSLRDTAVQLVVDGMEKARGVRGSALLSGRAACGTSDCPATVTTAVATLLGDGVTRLDKAGTGTLTLPQPGTQPDGSVVAAPGDPEVVSLDSVTFKRYYDLGACYQAPVLTSTANIACGTLAASATLVRLVVTVTWPGSECPANLCSYSSTGLFSSAVADPFLLG